MADAATGKDCATSTPETVATRYQSAPTLAINWRYLPESNEFLWFSQKSNWGHLYLRPRHRQKRQVTRGDWNVTDVQHRHRRTYPVGSGVGRGNRDPYFVHYYKLGWTAARCCC